MSPWMIRSAAFGIALLSGAASAHAQSAPQPEPEPLMTLAPPAILDIANAAHGTNCEFEAEFGPDIRYTAYELVYKAEGDAPDQAARKGTLHEVFCNSGAYNVTNVYFLTLADDGAAGGNRTTPVQFSTPAFIPIYENDDSEKAVLRIDIQGFTAADTLVNATYDAAAGVLMSANKWRGVGDAGTSGTWRFLQGRFVLTHFEVDASYDGEINPTIIYDAAPESP
jgi:Protein of unknown function (DUF1176)